MLDLNLAQDLDLDLNLDLVLDLDLNLNLVPATEPDGFLNLYHVLVLNKFLFFLKLLFDNNGHVSLSLLYSDHDFFT